MRKVVLAGSALFSTVLLAMTGCEVEESRPVEAVVESEAAIVGGTPDTTHSAVVALIDQDQGSACSGTIIAKSGGTAWILTAGHCEGMDFALQADDSNDCFQQNNQCEAVYQVVNDTPHPNWNGDPGQGYDFRVLQISGAAGAPVIPAASNPDGVTVGTSIEAVGYGITSANNNSNTLRRHVIETVDQLDSLLIVADQTDGTGSCSGDSGGPILSNGKVVGVTSFGDQTCLQYGAYGRVQAVYASFIAPIIGQQVELTCDDCFLGVQNSTCSSEANTCGNSQQCNDLLTCFDGCTTNACYNDCATQYPTGYDQYAAFIDCGCNACATECASECGGSSSSSSTSTSSSSSSSAAGGGNAGGGDAGGATGNGGATNGSGSSEEAATTTTGAGEDDGGSSCNASGASSSTPSLLSFGLVGLLVGAVGRRRRRA